MPNIEQFGAPAPQTEMVRATIGPDSGSIIPNKTEQKIIQFSANQERTLQLAALGLSIQETADQMFFSLISIKRFRKEIIRVFEADSILDAVVRATKTGNLDLYESTKDLDINKISRLSEREKEVLETTTQDEEVKSNQETASVLHIQKITVVNHFKSISDKLGINRTRAVLLYLAYQKTNSASS